MSQGCNAFGICGADVERKESRRPLDVLGYVRQLQLGITKQVVGPAHSSIWKRWADGRQLVIVGEYHRLKFPPDRVVCEDGIPFLKWFRQQVEPDLVHWDIFLEIPLGGIRGFQLNPLNALQSYLLANPELKARVHWIDVRQEAGDEFLSKLLEDIAHLAGSVSSPESVDKMIDLMGLLFTRTTERIQNADLLTEKQISKVEYPQDRLMLRSFLTNRAVLLATIHQAFELAKESRDLSELLKYQAILVRINNSLMDFYFLARMLKPYVHNALLVCGDSHRLNLQPHLVDLGFIQVFPDLSPREDLGPYSCSDMPNLKSDVTPHPKHALFYSAPTLPHVFDEKAKERIVLSQLRSAIRHPYLIHQMNTSGIATLTEKQLLDLAEKYSLNMDKVRKVVSDWNQAGVLAPPAQERGKRKRQEELSLM